MSKRSINLSLFWIAGYLLIPVLTPYFNALDANGPRLLTQSIWTAVGLLLTLLSASKNSLKIKSFFQTAPGIAYGIFILAAGLSALTAINLNEWVVQLSKILPVFIATVLVYSLVSHQSSMIETILGILVIFLMLESLIVVNQAGRFIRGEVHNISQFGWIYVNRNILAASIFIKIPATLYFFWSRKLWKTIIAYVALTLSTISIFFLSARAFDIGLILIWATFSFFVGLRWLKIKERSWFKAWTALTLIILISFALFTLVQKNLYPTERDWIANNSVTHRLQQSLQTDQNLRIESWKRTGHLIKEHPLLGVGAGNWKISILKYESPATPDFKYMYKNHNDFLEATAETGIPGGLAYLAIFVLFLITSARRVLKESENNKSAKFLMFPAIGLIAYCVDAFFNFPMDRPVIQSLFAILLGMGLAVAYPPKQSDQLSHNEQLASIINWIFLIIMAGVILVNSLQFKSTRIQRLVKEDIVSGTYSHTADFLLEKYPRLPDINLVGSPIMIDQVRYLIHEKRYEEAKRTLLSDHSSPFDVQKEYYLGLIDTYTEQMDSACNSFQQVYQNKPLFKQGIILYSSALFDTGDEQKAFDIINLALEKQPEDAEMLEHKHFLQEESQKISQVIHRQAKQAFENKEYDKTISLITDLLKREPGFFGLYATRAWCYFYTNQFQKALLDLDTLTKYQDLSPEQMALKKMCLGGSK